ncbi:MAG: GDYXXLXY domain-containing protein [Alphaproteobacteria bacterium]|nr:GDYXXLXY domain-containing protein [Alphaproteobacteria bacterium]
MSETSPAARSTGSLSMTSVKEFLKRPPPQALLAATAFLVLMMGAVAVSHELSLRSGRELILAVRPVDPREILMGHYVQLAYVAGDPRPLEDLIDADEAPQLRETLAGDGGWVWAVFDTRTSPAAELVEITLSAPASHDEGRIAVRVSAMMTEIYPDAAPPKDGEEITPPEPIPAITVRVGPDRYYADQTEAETLDAALRSGERSLSAILSVSKEGEASLRGLQAEGERIVPGWF